MIFANPLVRFLKIRIIFPNQGKCLSDLMPDSWCHLTSYLFSDSVSWLGVLQFQRGSPLMGGGVAVQVRHVISITFQVHWCLNSARCQWRCGWLAWHLQPRLWFGGLSRGCLCWEKLILGSCAFIEVEGRRPKSHQ